MCAESRQDRGSASDPPGAMNSGLLACALQLPTVCDGGEADQWLTCGCQWVLRDIAMVDFDLAMGVTRLDRRLTAKDLDGLPHEWDTRYELIEGVLFMSRRPSFEHQDVIARVVAKLRATVLDHGGKIVSEPGIVWDEEGEDNVSPDLVIVFGNVPAPGEELRVCPQIVVEVLSKGEENRRRDLEAKRGLYWRRGALEYWVLDSEARQALRLSRGEFDWKDETLEVVELLQTPLLRRWKGIVVRELFED